MHVQIGLNTYINNNKKEQIDNVLTIKVKKNTKKSKNEKLEINELIY